MTDHTVDGIVSRAFNTVFQNILNVNIIGGRRSVKICIKHFVACLQIGKINKPALNVHTDLITALGYQPFNKLLPIPEAASDPLCPSNIAPDEAAFRICNTDNGVRLARAFQIRQVAAAAEAVADHITKYALILLRDNRGSGYIFI